jgi:hypothetical protein
MFVTIRAETSSPATPETPTPALVGQVVFMYAFDIAYDMLRLPVKTLLGQPVEQFAVGTSKRGPRQVVFYRPQMIRLPPVQRQYRDGPITINREVKFLPVGALAIRVCVPFAVNRLEQLVDYHDLKFTDGSYLYDEVKTLAEDVRRELMPYLVRPQAQLPEEEAYTVFCLQCPLRSRDGRRIDAEDWLCDNQREVASLLTEEPDPARLSNQEAEETTGKSFSYYDDDLVVVDWDAAIVVDQPRNFDEILYIMELANVQLAELEAYDRMLDDAVETAYRDIAFHRIGKLRTSTVQRSLRELRIDVARLSDELSNITKFFGDWHLARVYQALAARFHLGEWHRVIDEKLKTLDDLYQIMRSDMTNRWMLILEVTVVVLFVIEIINSLVHWTGGR